MMLLDLIGTFEGVRLLSGYQNGARSADLGRERKFKLRHYPNLAKWRAASEDDEHYVVSGPTTPR